MDIVREIFEQWDSEGKVKKEDSEENVNESIDHLNYHLCKLLDFEIVKKINADTCKIEAVMKQYMASVLVDHKEGRIKSLKNLKELTKDLPFYLKEFKKQWYEYKKNKMNATFKKDCINKQEC